MKGDLEKTIEFIGTHVGFGDGVPDVQENSILEKLKSVPEGKICLDLSYKSLNCFPVNFRHPVQFLQFLYLQGNLLQELPSAFFTNFPDLRRLDLRFNMLKSLPATIGDHKFLEVLLLQDNQIQILPKEIGKVARLRCLQLSGNPLTWPPLNILSGGLDVIKSFLLNNRKEQVVKEDIVENSSADSTEPAGENPLLTSSFPRNVITNTNAVRKCPSTIGSFTLKGKCHSMKGKTQREQKTQGIGGSSHALAVIQGKRFPLGYSKRPCSFLGDKIYKALIHQIWVDQLKQILQSQECALQKLKDKETLKNWRREAQHIKSQMIQHKWPGLQPPYDLDANCLKMLTRAGLHKFQNESLEKSRYLKPHQFSVKVYDLEERINQLIASFDKMKTSKSYHEASEHDPGDRCELLSKEMEKIRRLQQAVQALRLSV